MLQCSPCRFGSTIKVAQISKPNKYLLNILFTYDEKVLPQLLAAGGRPLVAGGLWWPATEPILTCGATTTSLAPFLSFSLSFFLSFFFSLAELILSFVTK